MKISNIKCDARENGFSFSAEVNGERFHDGCLLDKVESFDELRIHLQCWVDSMEHEVKRHIESKPKA